MKCQYCDKPATFHITELTEPDGPQILHLCEHHARTVLQKEEPSPIKTITGALAKQLQLGQTKEELRKLDKKACPSCGITFFEFRNTGRLGCPMDYTHFESDLTPLLMNIHDSLEHTGKRPSRAAANVDAQAELISLRKDMEAAVRSEQYEKASEIRDRINEIQGDPKHPGFVAPPASESHDEDADDSAGSGGGGL
ncbi:UvrB/UvrC motif-containing protein [Allorhodopirellula heiligendammensis]|uniref:UvrB/uvrC motif protein n=1 Tax=Allorhodopirellula heiligendammensis TaxID=2714739 RepID=A0A5C6BE07_9BACT|nr:UvrB/UvrC motif-containing protein [Allorhodopirellula heiligendammensis]TWU10200.1 UvrB/uvrC motif protein [Allorhodopirellula heiligendammensis]|tara:strand:+ start:1090 stop:1677 length:588 start_codon:yes stop_codon:yes gene_type:complete